MTGEPDGFPVILVRFLLCGEGAEIFAGQRVNIKKY